MAVRKIVILPQQVSHNSGNYGVQLKLILQDRMLLVCILSEMRKKKKAKREINRCVEFKTIEEKDERF